MRLVGESAAGWSSAWREGEGVLLAEAAVPARGTARLDAGRWQLVAGWRGGVLRVLAHDGRSWLELTVPYEGHEGAVERLQVRAGAPRHPVEVELDRAVGLEPGARRRAAVELPVWTRVVGSGGEGGARGAGGDGEGAEVGGEGGGARGGRSRGSRGREIAELLPPGVRTEWRGSEEGYVHHVGARLVLEPGRRAGEASVLVPLLLHNPSDRAVVLERLRLRIGGREVRGRRGRMRVRPRRVVMREDGRWHVGARETSGGEGE